MKKLSSLEKDGKRFRFLASRPAACIVMYEGDSLQHYFLKIGWHVAKPHKTLRAMVDAAIENSNPHQEESH